MKISWALFLAVVSFQSARAYGDGQPPQDRILGDLNQVIVEKLSSYSWFERVDALFGIFAKNLGANERMGDCNIAEDLGNPQSLHIEAGAKVPFFRLIEPRDVTLACESMGRSFEISSQLGGSSLSIGRQWGEPILLFVKQGSFKIWSRALSLRWRYPGGQAMLTSTGPVELVFTHSLIEFSARVMEGNCDLVSFKSIESDPVVLPVRLSADHSATWNLGAGKILHENESVSILPSGLANWVKVGQPLSGAQH